MKYLSVDFGLSHLGFAVSNGEIAEPVKIDVVNKADMDKLIDKVLPIVQMYRAQNIVIGFTQGKVGRQAKIFGEKLKTATNLPVFFQEEEFTTQKAIKQMLESGKRKSRRQTEGHGLAAANILQEYLEKQKSAIIKN